MNDTQTYIGVYDNVFDETFCNSVIARFEDIDRNTWHSTGRAVAEGETQFLNGHLGRSDLGIFFENLARDYANEINTKVGECMRDYQKSYIGFQDIVMGSYTCKVQRTSPRGGYHVWHSEHGGDVSSMRRIAVWILYLSTHEGEGETEFLQQGIRVAPKAGRVVLWPASFTHPHRGNPIYSGEKYIATGWFEHFCDITR